MSESVHEQYPVVSNDPEIQCLSVILGALSRHLPSGSKETIRIVKYLIERFHKAPMKEQNP